MDSQIEKILYPVTIITPSSPSSSPSATTTLQNSVAASLSTYILATSDPEGTISDTITALIAICSQNPRNIDLYLQTYAKTCSHLPTHLESYNFLHHRGAGLGQLLQDLRENLSCFSGSSIGRKPNHDKANVLVSASELEEEQWSKTFEMMSRNRECRTDVVMWNALAGRSLVLGLFDGPEGEDGMERLVTTKALDGHMKLALDPTNPEWTSANFVAGCVLFRTCAGSFFRKVMKEEKERLEWWKERLGWFLTGDERLGLRGDSKGEWGVKMQAAFVLENIHKGLVDESPEEIFKPGNWIY